MTWQTINKLLNRNKKKEKLSHIFQQKNSDINFSDPVHVIANKFNEYFVNVGPNLAKGIRKNDTISLNIFKINGYLSYLFMYRFKRLQNLPEFFNGYFTQNNEVHHYNTRNANKLHVNFSRTNYAKHTIVNKGVKIWNSLGKEISSIMFYCTFKKKSKIFFL